MLLAVLYLGAPGTFLSIPSAAELSLETTPSAGLIEDAGAFAEQQGWTLDQALEQNEINERLDWVQGEIAANRPGQFIGAKLSSEPTGAPTIYLKGPVDDFIQALITAAGTTITIVDEQPFSQEELRERQKRVGASLVSMGFEEWGTSYDFSGRGTIDAMVVTQAGSPTSKKEISDRVLAETGISVNVIQRSGGQGGKTAKLDSLAAKEQDAPSDQPDSWQPGTLLIGSVIGLVVLLGIVVSRSRRNSPGDS